MGKRADQKIYHYIYKITRFDGKHYTGMHSTDNLEDGYFGSGQMLWHSIQKYGKEAHTFEIIEYLPSRSALALREKEIVKTIKEDEMSLNLHPGGGGGNHSETTSQKISAALKGRKLSDENKQKVSAALKGKKKPEGFGDKVKASLTGRKMTEEQRKKMSLAKTGKALSEAHRKAQGDGRRGKPRSEEAKRKLSEYMKGKPNQSAKKLQKPCTVDGVIIYPSVRDLVLALGHGKTGVKSPSFRFI